MTECSTPEHVSGVTTKLGSHQKEIEKDRQTGSGDRAQTLNQWLSDLILILGPSNLGQQLRPQR